MSARDDRELIEQLTRIHGRFAEIGEKMVNSLDNNTETLARMVDQMAKLDELAAEVAQNTEVTKSAVAFIVGIKDQVLALQAAAQAAGDSPETIAQLHELAAQLDANSSVLASAITANTPVSEPTPPQPEPTVPETPAEPAPAEPAPPASDEPAAPVEVPAGVEPPAASTDETAPQ